MILIKMHLNKWTGFIAMGTFKFSVVSANSTAVNHNQTALIKIDVMAEMLQHQTMTFFAILVMLLICVIVVTFLLSKKLHFLPEALAVMILGVIFALLIKFIMGNLGVNIEEWENMQSFHPDIFFLVLLPPIIFESGYTLQKGDFFSNIGAILTYAVLGTTLSACFVGFSMCFLGSVGLAYKLNVIESLSFGSLISATDPVSTLALFSAMNADQDLYAIVFGESVLNDAVSIILTQTILAAAQKIDSGAIALPDLVFHSIGKFCMMFFVSAIIGVLFGLTCALLLKYSKMHNHPSLECVTMFIFAYMPYGLSEGLGLSGIMAILLCGITMSHYAHFNLSPIGQLAAQQIFRVLALVAETMVFLFLGLALLNGSHLFDIRFISWSLLTCLVARAVVVFPLSLFFIYCRSKENRISMKVLFLVWFSGLRGAVAYAQSLHLPLADESSNRMIKTTTLAVVVFTNVVLGGSTLPLVKLMKVQRKTPRSGISKSLGMGRVIGPSEASSQNIRYRARRVKSPMSIIRGWRRFDKKYLMPFFIRYLDSRNYEGAVTHMIDRWAKNEERMANQFLTSSYETDDHSPIVASRTRKNIVRPVRNFLKTVDDGNRTEDEGDSSCHLPVKVRFACIDELSDERDGMNYSKIEADYDVIMASDDSSAILSRVPPFYHEDYDILMNGDNYDMLNGEGSSLNSYDGVTISSFIDDNGCDNLNRVIDIENPVKLNGNTSSPASMNGEEYITNPFFNNHFPSIKSGNCSDVSNDSCTSSSSNSTRDALNRVVPKSYGAINGADTNGHNEALLTSSDNHIANGDSGKLDVNGDASVIRWV